MQLQAVHVPQVRCTLEVRRTAQAVHVPTIHSGRTCRPAQLDRWIHSKAHLWHLEAHPHRTPSQDSTLLPCSPQMADSASAWSITSNTEYNNSNNTC